MEARTDVHPVLPLWIGALLVPWVPAAIGRWIAVLAPATGLALLGSLDANAGVSTSVTVAGFELVLLRLDSVSQIFAAAFATYAVFAGLYAWKKDTRTHRTASLTLAGAGVGVVLAGDLLTLFLYWEILTFSSVFLICADRSKAAFAAAFRYLVLHLAGGSSLIAGYLLLVSNGASLAVDSIRSLDDPVSWLLLVGVLVNAAVPPLHAWLPDAYPRATSSGMAYLSAFTTKAAVYVLLRMFAGEEILIWAGVAMALYGVVFAVLENDIRRLLGYHIISQVGYMVCGVGIGTSLALDGVCAHAFSHIFYKGLLLMAAGAVLHATGGRSKLTELGGLGRAMPWTLALYSIGAMSISGFPLFSGFVSKSLVVSAAAGSSLGSVELLLTIASMGTFLHTGLKLPYFTFFGAQGSARVVRPVEWPMMTGMLGAAIVCTLVGVIPSLLYDLLPFGSDYHPYTADHIVTALQLLAGTALGFRILLSDLGGKATATLDVDRLYRRPLAWTVNRAAALFDRLGRAANALTGAAAKTLPELSNPPVWPLRWWVGALIAMLIAAGIVVWTQITAR